MLDNATRRELLNRARTSQFPGSILEVYRAAEQGIDILADHEAQMQQQMQVAETPQQQEVGLREEHAQGNTQASMAFPDVQPNQSFNTVGMKAPIDIQKIDNQGHLVESYKNVPPGIEDLPTGPYEGTIIESPAAYKKGGMKKCGYTQKYQTGGEKEEFENLLPGGWKDFEKSRVGKFIDAKGLRRDKDYLMATVGDYFGYEQDEAKDLALDAGAIINPAADFAHAATKAKEGKYTDAALYAGFGLIPFGAGPLVRGTKEHIINPVKNLFKSKPKPKSNFKSDIDWGKWNKEIPGNTALMDEYKHIEEITKQRGTWMKNLDGSKFKGSPEQFVQQRSKNFNVNMPNVVRDASDNIQINYHGSGSKFEVFDKSKFKSGVYGEGVYTSPDKEAILKSYANPAKGRTQGMARRSGQKPTENLYELYINSNRSISPNEILDFRNWGKRIEDLPSLKEWKSSEFGKKILKEYNHLKTDDDIISFIRQNTNDPVKESLLPESMLGDFMKVDNLHGIPEQVTPYWNYMKSSKYNSGMFDMTNPNIYKQKGGIRDNMMNFLHDTGRDTTYVNVVRGAIGQHESRNNPNQVQVSGNKEEGFYDGPGRGTYQYEVGTKRGGNTALNRQKNFLDAFTNKTLKDFPKLYELYKNKSVDFTNLTSNEQDAVFIADKIYGGSVRRNEFDMLVKNRTTPPSQEETFMYWLRNHKGRINNKKVVIETKDDNKTVIQRDLNPNLTAEEIEVERQRWNKRTKNMFRRGGLKNLIQGFEGSDLKHTVDDISEGYNAFTNPSYEKGRLLLQGNIEPGANVGWNPSGGATPFGSPTVGLTGKGGLKGRYNLGKGVDFTAGVNYATGSRPQYKAGLNIKLKRGGYKQRYL